MGVVEPVRSSKNPRLQAIRALRAGRDRDHLLLEGEHLLAEGMAARADLEWVLHDPEDDSAERRRLLEEAEQKGLEVVPCDRSLLDEVSDLSTAPGLLAWGRRPQTSLAEVLQAARESRILVVVAGIQDPGNLGAVVRASAGLGAGGLVALQGGASLWHPRALRGASGTTFRIPVADRVAAAEMITTVPENDFELWEASAQGEDLRHAPKDQRVALVLGEEGAGVPAEVAAACNRRVGLPLMHGVESLNVATAAAVQLFILASR